MMRTYLPWLLLGSLLAAVVAVVVIRGDRRVLSDAIGLTVYSNGSAMVQVPFRLDGPEGTVSVMLDLNGDGTYGDGETVVDRFPALPQRYWNSNYYFRRDKLTSDKIRVKVVFTGHEREETVEQEVSPTVSDDGIRASDFAGVTKPELSMRTGTPDLAQRDGECAPAAAADTLIALAKEHGEDGRLPSDNTKMTDELRGDMRWTPANGVMPDDFVAGSNLWTTKKGLAIKTVKVGNQTGTRTLDELNSALASGSGALLRISFAVPVRGGSRTVGGHLVAVTGIRTMNGKTYIDINDPLSPSGTDTYTVDGNRITDYTFFAEGSTTLSWGFTQSWTK